MTILKKKINEKGIKLKKISKELNIEYRPLQRYINYQNITGTINFIKLLNYLDINTQEIINDIKKTTNKN